MADIVLITPRFYPTYWGLDYALPLFRKQALVPPLNLCLLAALTPAEHQVTIIDENVEDIDYERCARADIVGVTGMAVQRERMRDIITELKGRKIFTVLGGPWATVSPEDLGPLADVVFIGEAEQTWPQFLAEWSQGRHRPRYEQLDKTDMSTLPPPRLDLLKADKYLYGSLQVSRGCPFTCEFCDIIVVFGRRPRLKSPAQVIAELEGLTAAGIHDAFIVDDNLIGNKKQIKTILRAIIEWQERRGYPLSFVTEASIDLAEDEEMMRLMLEANIDAVFVGIESPNEEALRETKKIQNLTDRHGTILDKVRHIQETGLLVSCGMIVGFDSDDESVFERQREFIRQSRIPQAAVGVLFAIPQTPLHRRLASEGRLRQSFLMANWGLAAATNVVPLRMTPEMLREGYRRLLTDLYAPEAYFDRLDAMLFETKWLPAPGRTHHLLRNRHYRRWLKLRLWAGIQALYLFFRLMRDTPDAGLRLHYRKRIWNAIKRRPNIRLIRVYCISCVMHLHYFRLAAEIAEARPVVSGDVDPTQSAAERHGARTESIAHAAAD